MVNTEHSVAIFIIFSNIVIGVCEYEQKSLAIGINGRSGIHTRSAVLTEQSSLFCCFYNVNVGQWCLIFSCWVDCRFVIVYVIYIKQKLPHRPTLHNLANVAIRLLEHENLQVR